MSADAGGARPALARARAGGGIELLAPAPGLWGAAVRPGSALGAGDVVGALEVLGRRAPVTVPGNARGVVREVASGRAAWRAVGYGDVLAVLGEAAEGASAAPTSASAAPVASRGLVFRAPSSGRYYRRAAPGKPAFVDPGQVIAPGQVVGLIEVMKTFSRLVLEGDELPPRVRIARIVPADGDDVEAGQVLLELAAE
jgi:acetyl-CoA carboxylase biotin carboxyl carrier protein